MFKLSKPFDDVLLAIAESKVKEMKNYLDFSLLSLSHQAHIVVSVVHVSVTLIYENHLSLSFQSDRKGSEDKGPKSWGTNPGQDEGGWKSWILPMLCAFAASVFYRLYFSKN